MGKIETIKTPKAKRKFMRDLMVLEVEEGEIEMMKTGGDILVHVRDGKARVIFRPGAALVFQKTKGLQTELKKDLKQIGELK